jgi:hypothetical protein
MKLQSVKNIFFFRFFFGSEITKCKKYFLSKIFLQVKSQSVKNKELKQGKEKKEKCRRGRSEREARR